MSVLHNGDVLEVIAEYACGAVQDACALRAANKAYRRAVDTTVRRWVYEDQAELRTDRGGQTGARATLRLHRDSTVLDAVRIAFTCDAFDKTARLVVVAFALDGAKDELHEGAECGPRPVSSWEHPAIQGHPFPAAPEDLTERVHWCVNVGWTVSSGSYPDGVRRALLRCSAVASLSAEAHVEAYHALLSDGGGGASPPQVVALACTSAATASPAFPDLLAALGHRLTHLALELEFSTEVDIPARMCTAVAACTRVTHLSVAATKPSLFSPWRTAALCDAVIAVGKCLDRRKPG
jgi:hypothetical protein